jgi:NAD-dependent deacetylase
VTGDPYAGVARAIAAARRVTAFTGAGVSAASGIPTFRGADGLWRKVRVETLATPEAFDNDPRLVWEWYDWRRGMIRAAEPNEAHRVIASWTRRRPGVTVVTQNVDGLHERAGADPVLRLHGSIWHVRCRFGCDAGREDWRDDTVPLPSLPPRCPHCGGLARPAVVWFGEPLDPRVLAAATNAAACDVFLTVGTAAVVYPAAGLIQAARRAGAMVVEINPEATGASDLASVVLRARADQALQEIDARLSWRADAPARP